AADYLRVASETPLPEFVADYHFPNAVLTALFIQRSAGTKERRNTEERKESLGNRRARNLFHIFSSQTGAIGIDSFEALKRGGLLSQIQNLGGSETRATNRTSPIQPNDRQTLRFVVRQRSQQYPVYHTENRSVSANAQSKSENRDRCKPRALSKHSQTESQVLP